MTQNKIHNLKSLPIYKSIMGKMTVNPLSMTDEDKIFILTCAILLIKQYEKDNRRTSYIELAYYIILNYSLTFHDYEPLYDFSVNFGFFPLAQAITSNRLIEFNDISNSLISFRIQHEYEKNNIIETQNQKNSRNNILQSKNKDICYIAPTSFGKSSLIIEHIKRRFETNKKIAIIVPTKSLLMQTYRNIRKQGLDTRILIHDEMYRKEDRFICVFTQERALRLLEKNSNLSFDIMYVDEAHKLFEKDSRSLLLSRLIKLNKMRNVNTQTVYLSPLITNVSNLKYTETQNIFEQKIKFNIKEPKYFEYRTDGRIYKYNRFVNEFYEVGYSSNMFEYIFTHSTKKTFCYLYSPKKIEEFTNELASRTEGEVNTIEVEKILYNLRKYVHDDFYAIDYVKKGVIYLHGKMPNNVKEYLEYKYNHVEELKFLVANKVVLEGMNFPIDSLFILNATNLKEKDMINLIGRVNRLDQIFGKENNLSKLLPPIHFVNSDKYNRVNGKLENKITKLKEFSFEDKAKNPLLENFDISKETETNKEQCKKIIQYEEQYFSIPNNEQQILKKKMIGLGLNSIYDLSDSLCGFMLSEINKLRELLKKQDIHVLDKLTFVFIKNIDMYILDKEFKRLRNDKAVLYYKSFLENRHRTLKENVSREVAYFEKLKQTSGGLMYIGASYGEVAINTDEYTSGQKVYIDLNTKTKKELVNLAITKLKIEEDFVDNKLLKFFQLLFDYDLLTQDEYNEAVYGTNDTKKIELIKMGLTINIINRLKEDKQLNNVNLDCNNNLKVNRNFEEYRESVDDFYKFELDKYL